MLLKNLFFRHAMSQPAENIVHSDPHPANARLAVSLVRFYGDPRVLGRHGSIIAQLLNSRLHDPHDPARSPVTLATAKLIPFKLRSGGMRGMERG